MAKILTSQKFKCGGGTVGILIECGKDPEHWSAYTHRTFWAIPWINDNFFRKFWSNSWS